VINATRPVLVCVLYFTVGRGQNGNACADKCVMSFRGSAVCSVAFSYYYAYNVHDILLYYVYVCVCVCIIRVCCEYNIGVVTPSPSVVKTLRSLVTRRLHIIIYHNIYYTTAVRSRWRLLHSVNNKLFETIHWMTVCRWIIRFNIPNTGYMLT